MVDAWDVVRAKSIQKVPMYLLVALASEFSNRKVSLADTKPPIVVNCFSLRLFKQSVFVGLNHPFAGICHSSNPIVSLDFHICFIAEVHRWEEKVAQTQIQEHVSDLITQWSLKATTFLMFLTVNILRPCPETVQRHCLFVFMPLRCCLGRALHRDALGFHADGILGPREWRMFFYIQSGHGGRASGLPDVPAIMVPCL